MRHPKSKHTLGTNVSENAQKQMKEAKDQHRFPRQQEDDIKPQNSQKKLQSARRRCSWPTCSWNSMTRFYLQFVIIPVAVSIIYAIAILLLLEQERKSPCFSIPRAPSLKRKMESQFFVPERLYALRGSCRLFS